MLTCDVSSKATVTHTVTRKEKTFSHSFSRALLRALSLSLNPFNVLSTLLPLFSAVAVIATMTTEYLQLLRSSE